jgi:hypothetical protein
MAAATLLFIEEEEQQYCGGVRVGDFVYQALLSHLLFAVPII